MRTEKEIEDILEKLENRILIYYALKFPLAISKRFSVEFEQKKLADTKVVYIRILFNGSSTSNHIYSVLGNSKIYSDVNIIAYSENIISIMCKRTIEYLMRRREINLLCRLQKR